ncbi:hypothetical protein [Micromonospora sp. DH14]|uniref:hypothetical protein n=1 Tax=Micromonospora sp. DH14 TaxID=3040120 RepID=UPI0024435803|nr:hypothetical protein [Micromonospora sp. DH14]MDG9676640.1 hypothetical protein [Micromonospora sp. DH14]
MAGWMVFGWVSRRTEGRRRRGAVKAWHPYWEWLGQPTASLLFLVGAGCVLLALGLAAGARSGLPNS